MSRASHTSLVRDHRFNTMCLARAVIVLVVLGMTACAGVANRAAGRFAQNLNTAVLQQEDPALVRDGLPSYLLLLDAMVAGAPDDAALLRNASALYASYAGSFVQDPVRAGLLSQRGLEYARRATCIDLAQVCDNLQGPFADFNAAVDAVPAARVDALYALAGAWATWIQAHSEQLVAIADMPRVEALLQRVVTLAPAHDRGLPWVYIGVLNSLRPAAVGGEPERGRAAFEQAIVQSSGRNLMAKTLFARHYARLVFDQALHDELLEQVIAADPRVPGFTLINTLAQQQARELLAGSKDYF